VAQDTDNDSLDGATMEEYNLDSSGAPNEYNVKMDNQKFSAMHFCESFSSTFILFSGINIPLSHVEVIQEDGQEVVFQKDTW
jgi:hypothetical protein